MKEISRRTVLAGTAAATIAMGVPATACAESPKNKKQQQATSDCGDLGSTGVCVTARAVQDVTGLQYVITNNGDRTMTYTAWYVDQTGGPESGRVTHTVNAGENFVGYFYGALEHCFTLHVCQDDGAACLTLGPVCGEHPSDW
ncbi:hypothetical protein AB0M28_01825 [Streptomyces sp. NPDC051940]|uniref:hypothetical protein n=1 Tax=Streptomyces sp. NPDC051940 TaxID=3155675 RepID=UPI0034436FCD